MHAINNPFPIYLDQNILSHLREGMHARDDLTWLLKRMDEQIRKAGEHNPVFVYSETHVEECRGSARPEAFVQVMEELPVYLMEFQNASDNQTTFSLGRAREALLEPEDATHKAKHLMEGLLNVMHFASGWLGDTEARAIKDEMVAENETLWKTLQHDLDWELLEVEVGPDFSGQAKREFVAAQRKMDLIIKNLPFEQTKDEWKVGWAQLRERLPPNFAQLDEVPDDRAVSFMFSCLEERERKLIQNQFPQDFWRKLEKRETGDLAGLAFMLFLCGLVRDSRVKTGANKSRIQYFRGQFRDGTHIENAARCAMFVTFDRGAARLARSLYAYAGVETKVIELKIAKAPAQLP